MPKPKQTNEIEVMQMIRDNLGLPQNHTGSSGIETPHYSSDNGSCYKIYKQPSFFALVDSGLEQNRHLSAHLTGNLFMRILSGAKHAF